ncbi:hypothetical protein RJ640_025859 [Escallonia rubra]|uniref:Diacylglycerol O-acyltransferase 3, cytosolic n=1 Tax=Escallonia rubra TaxID=112253 RepID=A0AA88QHW0_9ASTE|nr:hypothetical protein RJ640_025859 [Escallonia rubra]
MEVTTGAVCRPLVPCFSPINDANHYSSSSSSSILSFTGLSLDTGARFPTKGVSYVKPIKRSASSAPGFWDSGHVQYYCQGSTSTSTRCGGADGGIKEKQKEKKAIKKRLKLLKGLSKDLSTFSAMDFGLDPHHVLADQVKGKMISDASELLLSQLQQLRTVEKETKRRKKEEKAKLKAARMQNTRDCESSSSSSSSSESSDSECGEVIDMSRLKSKAPLAQLMPNELQPAASHEPSLLDLPSGLTQARNNTEVSQPVSQQDAATTLVQVPSTNRLRVPDETCCSGNHPTSFSNVGYTSDHGIGQATGGGTTSASLSARKIEVCMGGKCKKSGAGTLLEEFQRAVGGEGTVVGCKCMGKCRDGPNVRVSNSVNAMLQQAEDSIRTPANPLCIGVGLDDVSLIVSNFFGANQRDLGGLAVAS